MKSAHIFTLMRAAAIKQGLSLEVVGAYSKMVADLIEWLLIEESMGRAATLKHLYLSLAHGEKNLRQAVSRLEAGGWIRKRRSTTDSRQTLIEPTQKLLDLVELVAPVMEAAHAA